jgi:hypothetical protein
MCVLPKSVLRKETNKQDERKVMINSKLATAQDGIYGPLTEKEYGMNAGRPTRTTLIGIITLAACLLVRPAVASLDNPVTRPLIVVEGHLTIVVHPATGAYEFTDWGWATHTGLFTNSGSGVLNLATGEFLSGSGVVFAANGDTLDWIIGTTPNTVVYTGGTGRFQGVTGGFLAVITSVTPLSSNPDGTVTLAITYDGSGTITY